MYISIGIIFIILIILILILLKITYFSSIKTIEKFEDSLIIAKINAILNRNDEKLTKLDYNFLRKNNSVNINRTNEEKKNKKLENITYDEITKLIATYYIIATDSETKLIDIKNLMGMGMFSPSTNIEPSINRNTIKEDLGKLNTNIYQIKDKMLDIIRNADKVRYIQYSYYLSYWDSYFDIKLPRRPNAQVFDLYKSLFNNLKRTTDAETQAVKYYLFVKGFITMKPGSDIYNRYIEELGKNNIFTIHYKKNGKFSHVTGKIKIDLEKRDYNTNPNCGNEYDIKNTTTRNLVKYDDTNEINYNNNYGEDLYYVWTMYDLNAKPNTICNNYLFLGERPQNVYLKGGSSCNYQRINCASDKNNSYNKNGKFIGCKSNEICA